MPHIFPHAPLTHIVGSLIAALTLAACSSGSSETKREYSVPSSLCETAVPSSSLASLLPAGKKISAKKSGTQGFTRCRLAVDGQVVVSSIIEQWESGTSLLNVAYGTYGMRDESTKKENSKYIFSNSIAVGHASCSKQQKGGHEIFTMIRKEHGSVNPQDMEKVITEFTDSVSKSEKCTESDD